MEALPPHTFDKFDKNSYSSRVTAVYNASVLPESKSDACTSNDSAWSLSPADDNFPFTAVQQSILLDTERDIHFHSGIPQY
jgi:hypothetical protein